MRKSRQKQRHYEYLSKSPSFTQARCTPDRLSRIASNRNLKYVSNSGITRSQSTLRPSTVKQQFQPNFIRIGVPGQPSHSIVHIPKHIASIRPNALNESGNTSSLEDLIEKRGPGFRNNQMVRSMRDRVKSVKVPKVQFNQLKRVNRQFEISGSDRDRKSASVNKGIRENTPLKEQQASVTSRLDVTPQLEELAKNVKSLQRNSISFQELKKSNSQAVRQFTPMQYPSSRQFWVAVKTGDLKEAELLIKRNKNVMKTVDSVGQTALHWVAKRNDIKMARMLLRHNGIDVDHADSANRTALWLAAKHDCPQITAMLLDKQSDYTIKSLTGKSAIDVSEKKSNTATLIASNILQRFPQIFANQMKKSRQGALRRAGRKLSGEESTGWRRVSVANPKS